LKSRITCLFPVICAGFLILTSGCRSHHVQITVENRTGGPIRLLEVDYPSASFGADSVEPGQVVRSSIQVRGSGPVKILFTAPDRHQAQITGPTLIEKQEGKLAIVLLPNDKAEFHQ
jgi:hypothetical protein